jgi:hypothetical protein
MTLLTRQAILDALDLSQRRVPVPEWGGDVIVRALKANERDAIEAHFLRVKAAGGDVAGAAKALRPLVLSLCLVDDKGERLFKGDADVVALGEKNANIVSRLYDVASDLNALTPAALGEVEKK